jgi:hypothetical protein
MTTKLSKTVTRDGDYLITVDGDTTSHKYSPEEFEPLDFTNNKELEVMDKVSCYVCHVGAYPMQQYCGSCGHELLSELVPPQPIITHAQGYSIKGDGDSKTLTYTQAMADNGELPSVGMDCMAFVDENEKEVKEWFKGVVCGEYEGSPVIKLDDLTDGTEGYFDVFSRVDIKPLTPPIEPEEKALNDMIEQLKNEGICSYDPIMLRILIAKFKANKIHGVSFQPLTVEVTK